MGRAESKGTPLHRAGEKQTGSSAWRVLVPCCHAGVGFLIGAVSICGLPPFNGFISEFLIYKSLFQGSNLMGDLVPLVFLVSAVGLAFVGGLAVACFTKLYGVVFLGEKRSKPSEQPGCEAVSSFPVVLGLAALCVWIGFAPGAVLRLVAPAVSRP